MSTPQDFIGDFAENLHLFIREESENMTWAQRTKLKAVMLPMMAKYAIKGVAGGDEAVDFERLIEANSSALAEDAQRLLNTINGLGQDFSSRLMNEDFFKNFSVLVILSSANHFGCDEVAEALVKLKCGIEVGGIRMPPNVRAALPYSVYEYHGHYKLEGTRKGSQEMLVPLTAFTVHERITIERVMRRMEVAA